jgi:asparagine synthase (glutamine-hydrolysing)
LLQRPKQGFAIPLDRWLRGDLREWAESLLSPVQIIATGVFDPRKIEALWRDHQSNRDNVGWRLWAILMMQSWLLHNNSAGKARLEAHMIAPRPRHEPRPGLVPRPKYSQV